MTAPVDAPRRYWTDGSAQRRRRTTAARRVDRPRRDDRRRAPAPSRGGVPRRHDPADHRRVDHDDGNGSPAVGHVAGNGGADDRAAGPTADAGDTAADAGGAVADAGHDPADRPTDDAPGRADLDARRQPRRSPDCSPPASVPTPVGRRSRTPLPCRVGDRAARRMPPRRDLRGRCLPPHRGRVGGRRPLLERMSGIARRLGHVDLHGDDVQPDVVRRRSRADAQHPARFGERARRPAADRPRRSRLRPRRRQSVRAAHAGGRTRLPASQQPRGRRHRRTANAGSVGDRSRCRAGRRRHDDTGGGDVDDDGDVSAGEPVECTPR